MRLFMASVLLVLTHALLWGQPTITGIRNSADGNIWIAFGSLVSIYGTNLAPGEMSAQSLPLPLTLNDTEVLLCSGPGTQCQSAPLLYVGRTQINALVPETAPDSATVYVRTGGAMSDGGSLAQVRLYPSVPTAFVMGYDCSIDPRHPDGGTPCGLSGTPRSGQQPKRAAVTDQSGNLITSSNPARLARDYTLWVTGLGALVDARAVMPFSLLINDIPVYGAQAITSMKADISYAGASSFPGLNQINFRLPQNLITAANASPAVQICGEYRLELAFNLRPEVPAPAGGDPLLRMPVLIQRGDAPCIDAPGDGPRPDGFRVANPYAAGGTPRKTQLHTHTIVAGKNCAAGDSGGSDGSTCPSEKADAYAAAGYNVVAITDHDVRSTIAGCTWDQNNSCLRGGVLYLAGSEQTITSPSFGHMPAIGVSQNRGAQQPLPVENAQQALAGAISDGGFAFLAHPSLRAQTWSYETATSLAGLKAVEAFNGLHYRGDYLWDRMLGNGYTVYGLAVDDSHSTGADFDKGWTVVYTDKLTRDAVVASLNAGNFYAVQCTRTPCLDFSSSISFTGRTIQASTSASAYYMWIGWRDGYKVESGQNAVLDAAHSTNRRISIPGRPFTVADVGRILYISSYNTYVRTGTYHITGISGTSAVLDRIVGSTGGVSDVVWELNGGTVLRATRGTSDSYTITNSPAAGDHRYVRLYVVQDEARQLWSQPFFVK